MVNIRCEQISVVLLIFCSILTLTKEVIQSLISCIAFQQRWTVLTTPRLKKQSDEAQQDFYLGSYKPTEKSVL